MLALAFCNVTLKRRNTWARNCFSLYSSLLCWDKMYSNQKVGVVKFAPLDDCLNFFAREVLRMPNAQMFKDWLHQTGQGTSAIPLQHMAEGVNHE